MAVLGRLLLGSGERLDLPDLLAVDSYTSADFKYLIQSFIGGDRPFVLKGFDVVNPQDSIGTENVSVRVADSVVYYPGSLAGSFYYGLPEGSTNTEALVPELRKNATNFVYLTFSTFDTAQDSRAFWDPDQNGGNGGEFSQDVNTESVLSVEVGVSVSTFPDNAIPVCKVVVGASVIESIQDCRDMMFRLGSGGTIPDPFNSYAFRNDPTAPYARMEPPTTMNSASDPNPFQGGDKNILTLKEWMDVVMTKLKELSGTTYWYEAAGTTGTSPITINNVFTDALASTLKSKGQWQHSGTVAGEATWTEDIHYLSLRDPRDLILRASTITLANEEVAWIDVVRGVEINNASTPVAWLNSSATVNGVTGAFGNLAKGDWVKKKPDLVDRYLRVEEFYALPNLAGGTTTPALAQSIRLSAPYAGTTGSEIGEYTKGEYLVTDVNITSKTDPSVLTAGGNFFWIAYRSDTALGLTSAVPTQLTIDITEGDGERARVTSTVAHGLVNGDRVTITTGPYAGTYVVEVGDTDDFYINTTVTGDSLAQTAFYAIVTTASRSTAYSYALENANHGFQSNEHVTIQGTSSLYDASYLINVRSATTFQIPIGSLIPNPGAVSGEIVVLPRMNVRTEFGTVKIVQGEDVNIGDADSKNILTFIGMESLAQTKPNYHVPSGSNMLRGHQNYNSDENDNLTIRAARLTAMMADRIQDRGMQIVGRTNITSVTNAGNQDISALADLLLVRPSSPDQVITLTTPISLPANSAIVIDVDRDGSAALVPSVISLGNDLLIEENRIILWYRFGTTTVYDWRGDQLQPYGHINTQLSEDSQNRNVAAWNPGSVKLDAASGLLEIVTRRQLEIAEVTVLAGASVPQSSYFYFNSAYDATEYYVWYNVGGAGVDPLVPGKTGIMVAITNVDTDAQVATATASAINAAAGADVTAGAALAVVTITWDLPGPVTDAVDGAAPTGFTIEVVQEGFAPDIEIMIPGSDSNIVDSDAINLLGTLIVPNRYSVWVRINRFAPKTFNVTAVVDGVDTDLAGALYITPTTDVPMDQDVFVLWTRIDGNILVTQHTQDPKSNVYDEPMDVVAGIPANPNEIQGPVVASTLITLPLDTRDANSPQEYIIGSGQLEVYLNGQYLRPGVDYIEYGIAYDPSSLIQINMDLVVGDVLTFRIDAHGAVYYASNASSTGSLQDAYDNGRFVTVLPGQPIVINGTPGQKLFSVQGDMDVTGVIDPAGITFSQQAMDPLDTNDHGLWRNASDELIYKVGVAPSINLSTDYLRRDGTLPMLGDLDMNGFQIVGVTDAAADTVTVRDEIILLNNAETFAVHVKAPDLLAADWQFTLPSTQGIVNQYLQTDGAGNSEWADLPPFGDVDGPVVATNNAVARFDGITGKLLKDSYSFIIDDVLGSWTVHTADLISLGVTSDALTIRTGNHTDLGATGALTLTTGTSSASDSGEVVISTGDTLGAVGDTGSIRLYTGTPFAGSRGDVVVSATTMRSKNSVEMGGFGDNFVIAGGDGVNASESGGWLILNGGAGGTDGAGGTVIISSGNTPGTTGSGGDMFISAGNGPAIGGMLTLSSGSSSEPAGTSGLISLGTGSADFNSGQINLSTGPATSVVVGISGGVQISTGQAATITGNVDISTGASTVANGISGAVNISTGSGPTTTGTVSGFISMGTGGGTTADSTGQIDIFTGSVSTVGNTGAVAVITGQAKGAGKTSGMTSISTGAGTSLANSGILQLLTGNATGATGDSGDIQIRVGSSVGGSRGDLILDASTIRAPDQTESYNGFPETLIIRAGEDDTMSGGFGGSIFMNSGNGTNGGGGGTLIISAGNGDGPGSAGGDAFFSAGSANSGGFLGGGVQINGGSATGAGGITNQMGFRGGDAVGSGGMSGLMQIGTGSAGVNSGYLDLYTGDVSDLAANAGNINLRTGSATNTNSNSGYMVITTGTATNTSSNSGSIDMFTGQAYEISGNLNLSTGQISSPSGFSGALNLTTGDAGTGTSGDISLATGSATAKGRIGLYATAFFPGNSSTPYSLTFYENGAPFSDTVSIQAPTAITSTYTLTLPQDAGTSGYVLSTDGSGVLSWIQATSTLDIVSVSSDVTLTNNAIHLVDTSAARSLALPAPAVDLYIVVKDSTGTGAATNNITITRPGAQLIDAVAANYTINSTRTAITIVSDGTNYFLI